MALTERVKRVVENQLCKMNDADVASVVVAFVDRRGNISASFDGKKRDLFYIAGVLQAESAKITEDGDE